MALFMSIDGKFDDASVLFIGMPNRDSELNLKIMFLILIVCAASTVADNQWNKEEKEQQPRYDQQLHLTNEKCAHGTSAAQISTISTKRGACPTTISNCAKYSIDCDCLECNDFYFPRNGGSVCIMNILVMMQHLLH